MERREFLQQYRDFVAKRGKRIKVKNLNKYVSDKISRANMLLRILSKSTIEMSSESEFIEIMDLLSKKTIDPITRKPKPGTNDYTVILRQFFQMQTSKKAPKNTHYAGVKRKKYES